MNKLKELRRIQNLTQVSLAEILKTTQQTVQRWESGKTSIPSSALKDLAVVLNCSVDEILGVSQKSRTLYTGAFISKSKRARDTIAHYGGVVLSINEIKEALDYPIDTQALRAIRNSMPDLSDDPIPFSWMYFETMNNYELFINLKFLKVARVYSDACSASPEFFHPEVYRILTEWHDIDPDLSDSELADYFEASESLIGVVKDIVKEYEEVNKDWDSFKHFHDCKVHWIDGETTSHYLDRRLYSNLSDLATACDDAHIYSEAHVGERFIVEEDEGGYEQFLNLNQIVAIEVPAVKYWQVACEVEPELLEIGDISSYMPTQSGGQIE